MKCVKLAFEGVGIRVACDRAVVKIGKNLFLNIFILQREYEAIFKR